MNRVRALAALLLINGLLAVLLLTLFRIQVVSSRDWSARRIDLVAASVAQRRQGVELNDGRGVFTDRYGRRLTGFDDWALAVFPEAAKADEEQLSRLRSLIGAGKEQWDAFIRLAKLPAYWPGGDGTPGKTPAPLPEKTALALRALNVPGVRVVKAGRRYEPSIGARHWIGYVSEDPGRAAAEYGLAVSGDGPRLPAGAYRIGGAGLERTFDRFIRSAAPSMLYRFVDGRGEPYPGLGLRQSQPERSSAPLAVRLTMDLDIQRLAEAALDAYRVRRGAVVVLDVRTSDILAMASRPDYSPYDVNPADGRWRNQAVSAAIPGSVFKTVVAAAALEAEAAEPDEIFGCSGSLGRYGFHCWKPHGHGILTFREGFAQSCNLVFAEAMRRLTTGQLERMAAQLGIGRRVGWSEDGWMQLDGEDAGQLFGSGTDKDDDGVRVQTAIGQRDVRMTPLQGAQLAAMIARGGSALEARSATEVRFAGGRLLRRFEPHALAGPHGRGGISPAVARTLREWMRDVVLEGTGQALQRARWPLAGKSGTAVEPSARTADGRAGEQLEHHWFIGYGPADRPRYAVAVLAADVKAGSGHRAVPLFGRVMDGLAAYEENRAH
ncbi:peptidoglycan D,D-transpeptidase FtsI family protein [Paenibacillus thermoaerophilus]|uniref:Peptidoglycan D,D-transpeptidase FtsI family protein n=1 Tax=Paenibacillus thermoaerophilus TaxID=1215385 RepID=A0ABW2UZ13_9BACL|nr:penicillin-binding transpeptidase domain-containing protein [Paenibacillus thermoaerophilus]TMV17351.1 penicillin-binding protein 2 [Paenibacillus thermoaerophilus]